MPTTKSAKKRMRTSSEARDRNRSKRSALATARRKLNKATTENNTEDAPKLLRAYVSIVDKAVKQGVLNSSGAARRKSRAANRVAKLAATPKAAQ